MTALLRHNSPCPCGSGRKYRLCCLWRPTKWIPVSKGRWVRQIPIHAPLPQRYVRPLALNQTDQSGVDSELNDRQTPQPE